MLASYAEVRIVEANATVQHSLAQRATATSIALQKVQRACSRVALRGNKTASAGINHSVAAKILCATHKSERVLFGSSDSRHKRRDHMVSEAVKSS